MNFSLLFPNKIIFGPKESYKLGYYLKNISKKPLVISGLSFKKSDSYSEIISSLKKEDIQFFEYQGFKGEPECEIIDNITAFARANNVDSIIAIGGGSIIDSGKAVSALAVNDGKIEDYLEGIGNNKIIKNEPLAFIALPTTSGSGAEATKNAVITSKKHKCKRSFRDERLIAKLVILDPVLTSSLPLSSYNYSALDAVSQLIESFTSKKSNIFCKSIVSYILPKAFDALLRINKNIFDMESRNIMMLASFISGISLANSGLGAVHGFASSIGGLYDIPHGLICAVLLPGMIKLNHEKDKSIYKEMAVICGYRNTEKFINFIYQINKKINIPPNFKNFCKNAYNIDKIVALSKGSSMSGNPFLFNDNDLKTFIRGYF